jgi:hypothetical protein
MTLQSLEKTKRNEVLRYALSFGAGVRQLSRLPGIPFGVGQRLKNDQQNRPHDSGQLRFDQITGWSRWLKLNQQEPNLKCFVEPYTTIWSGPKDRK